VNIRTTRCAEESDALSLSFAGAADSFDAIHFDSHAVTRAMRRAIAYALSVISLLYAAFFIALSVFFFRFAKRPRSFFHYCLSFRAVVSAFY